MVAERSTMARLRGPRPALLSTFLLLVSALSSSCLALGLEPRDGTKNSTLPKPVSVAPDQSFHGIDGSWSTITLRVGTPSQYVQGFVSTASQQTWVVLDLACETNQTSSDNATTQVIDNTCSTSRGNVYNYTASSTWDDKGFYQLWTEKTLGLDGNGQYGYETVGLGYPGEEGPTLQNTTVGMMITNDFWLGHFGVNAKSTNFSAFEDPSPSYMTLLFQQNLIPSIAFGYTAGHNYASSTPVLASLTLGGYDTSRFIHNNLTFGFAPDNERDLVVSVYNMTGDTTTNRNIDLMGGQSDFTMFIDSTVAEMWLPVDVCHAFESAFGLTYDNTTGLYLVDDLKHQTLRAENLNVTLSLGRTGFSNATVDIVLPYNAFDMTAQPPYQNLENSTKFFPIRRGANESQWVLGRTFLQEAYLLVDWERQNFSVYQSSPAIGQAQNIVSLISPSLTDNTTPHAGGHGSGLSTGAIVGIAVSAALIAAIAAFTVFWLLWRKRHIAKVKQKYEAQAALPKDTTATERTEEPPQSPTQDPEEGTNVFPKAELPADTKRRDEYNTDVKEEEWVQPTEVDNNERQIFEMPGDIPTTQEAGGRMLSEKESMVARERVYNGVDPTGVPTISAPAEDAPRRLAPVHASEVALVNRRGAPSISPVTPRTPRDGALLEASDTFFQPIRTPRDGRDLEMDDALLSPISPVEGSSSDGSDRRRFSYEPQ